MQIVPFIFVGKISICFGNSIGTILKLELFITLFIISSFSLFSIEHVEYTISPGGFSIS